MTKEKKLVENDNFILVVSLAVTAIITYYIGWLIG